MAICPDPSQIFRYLRDALFPSPSTTQSSDPKIAKIVSEISEKLDADTSQKLPSITALPPPIAALIDEAVQIIQTAPPETQAPVPNKKRTLTQLRALMRNNQKEWENNNKGPVTLDKTISQNKKTHNKELMVGLYLLQKEYKALFAEQQRQAEARTKMSKHK